MVLWIISTVRPAVLATDFDHRSSWTYLNLDPYLLFAGEHRIHRELDLDGSMMVLYIPPRNP